MRLSSICTMKVMIHSTIGLSLCLLFATSGCDHTLAGKWQYKEVSRFAAPDSQVDAVLVEGDAGATTSTVFMIYLVPAGAKVELDPRTDRDVFAADHLKGFNVVWKEGRLLEIQYEEARILGFRNFWYGRDAENTRYVVELRLKPAQTEHALPLQDR